MWSFETPSALDLIVLWPKTIMQTTGVSLKYLGQRSKACATRDPGSRAAESRNAGMLQRKNNASGFRVKDLKADLGPKKPT